MKEKKLRLGRALNEDVLKDMAMDLINMVEDRVKMQHPEINLKTSFAKDAELEDPDALVVGDDYYELEDDIVLFLERVFDKEIRINKQMMKEFDQLIKRGEKLSKFFGGEKGSHNFKLKKL